MDCRRRTLVSLIIAGGLLAVMPAFGQNGVKLVLQPASGQETGETTPAPGEPPTLAEKRAENAELLRVAQNKVEVDPQDVEAAAELSSYKTAETVLAQQEAVEQQTAELQAREQELKEQLDKWNASAAEPVTPISFVQFDRLVNQLAAEQARVGLVQTKLKQAKTALEQAQTAFEGREQERRKSQEQFENGKDGPDATALAAALEDARRASSLAVATLNLRKRELEREKLAGSVQMLSVELLKSQVERYQPLVTFTQADLDAELNELKEQEETVRAALASADADASSAVAGWSRAKRDMEAAPEGDTTLLAENVEAWRLAREQARDRKNVALDQLLQIEQLRTAWNRLFALKSGTANGTPEQLATWKEETAQALRVLIGSTQAHLLRIEELRTQLAAVLSKAEAAKDAPEEVRDAIRKQRDYIEAMIRAHETNLVSIDANRRLHGKLRAELGRGIDLLSPSQWLNNTWSGVAWLWNYEIASHEDISITVGKIVRALLIFAFGWIVSRMLSVFFAHRLLKRFRLSKDATAVIRTVIFYSAIAIAALIALRSAHVPLTAFTILGGALAIGIGFGSQTLINNFISGLIMLAERPVRIGERIVFGKFDGMVEDVGFRCTKVRTLTDHLVTIPNSSLINDSIENVGRRRTIRRIVNLGITYDTPRERIGALVDALRDMLEEPGIREPIHPIVGWDKMPPRVFFQDFMADNLNIFLIYWYAPGDQWWDYMDHAHRVNMRIYEVFEELGVSFAFPSRTVYLANDAAHDLRMRLSKEDAA